MFPSLLDDMVTAFVPSDVGIGYATKQLQIPHGLIAEKVVVAGRIANPPGGWGRCSTEDGTWGLTTFTVGHIAPPQTFTEMCTVTDEILPTPLAAAIRRAQRRANAPAPGPDPVPGR